MIKLLLACQFFSTLIKATDFIFSPLKWKHSISFGIEFYLFLPQLLLFTKGLLCITSFAYVNAFPTLQNQIFSHFTDEESEAHSDGQVTSLCSLLSAKLGLMLSN